jgi:hypothetical protein
MLSLSQCTFEVNSAVAAEQQHFTAAARATGTTCVRHQVAAYARACCMNPSLIASSLLLSYMRLSSNTVATAQRLHQQCCSIAHIHSTVLAHTYSTNKVRTMPHCVIYL